MRIAVIGSTGMFGSDLLSALSANGIECQGFNRQSLDFEQSAESLAENFKQFDAVVNAVAFTAVDKAEIEIYEANTVNGIYAGVLARAAKIAGARFIHIQSLYPDGLGHAGSGAPSVQQEPAQKPGRLQRVCHAAGG